MSVPLPRLAGVEHDYVRVRGAELHYAHAGDGEPVVLQHGWPQHWWSWRALIGPLRERGYRVICPDLRGFGWSQATPGGYRKAELAEDLLALLDTLGLERVRLVGHDWGGYIGFLLCLAHPERVSHFIALSIPPPFGGAPDPRFAARLWYQVLLASPVVGELAVRRLGFGARVLGAARAAGTFTNDELEAYDAVLRQPAVARASSRLYRTFLVHELAGVVRGELAARRLTTPTRLLVGERDPLRRGIAASYDRYADDLRVEFVPGAGHFLPEERPDAVLSCADEFLGPSA